MSSRRLTWVACCSVLLASGCSKSTSPEPAHTEPSSTPSLAAPSPKHGGKIVLATISDPKSFNPIVAKETSTTAVTNLIFEGLTKTNGVTTEVEPALAASWQISEDGLRWTFHLREEVRWSDGQPLTADDVVFTFERLIYNPDVPASSRDIFTIDGKPIQVKALDANTVEFTLPVPFAPFLRALGQEILPAHKLRDIVNAGTFSSAWGLDTPAEEIIGTGPFKLSVYLPGQYVRFVRNNRYWRQDAEGRPLPYLNEVRMLIVQTQDVELLKFQEGELDVYGMRASDFALLKPDEAKSHYTVYELGPGFGSSFIFFNQHPGTNPQTSAPYVPPHKLAWFQDVRFRRAVAHAIDKQAIIEIVMNGLGFPQTGPMGPSEGFFYHPDVPTYAFDLERAKALLAQIGLSDRNGDGILEDGQGHPVEFTLYTNSGNTDRIQIANVIRKDLERLGMTVHLNQLEFNNLVAKLDATYDWDAILLGLTGGIEPHFGRNVWHSSGHLHMWHPRQPAPATEWEAELDRVFDQGVQELDPHKRKALYDRWQVIVAEQVPLIYTVLPPSIMAVRNRFGNLHPTAYGGALHNLEELYLLSSSQ